MQLREKDILGCLPLLASVLGNTYGVHVRICGSDACTNGNMIQLPSLPVDCGEELLLLVRGFIDHESAHIRYTDFKAFKEAALEISSRRYWQQFARVLAAEKQKARREKSRLAFC